MRIEELLKSASASDKPNRSQQARKVLKNIDTAEAKAVLKELGEAKSDR
jgi:hypothetical protein